MGALVAFACAVVFAALLGTGAPSAGADAACPNEAIRAAQGATKTADCRAWERVSPADKGGGDIIAGDMSIVAEKGGDGATFNSLYGFGDTIGSGAVGRTTYLARRGPAGWSTHSLMPTPAPEANQVVFTKDTVQVFSEDLSTALIWAYDLPSVTGDTPQRMNLYVEDTATRSFRPVSVSQVDPLQLFDFIDPNSAPLLGVSDDAKHLAFKTTTQMLPDAAPFTQNVYQWDDGVLSVAGKLPLPDGNAPSAGATVFPKNIRNTMSPDGTRLVFTSTGDGSDPAAQLYMRIDGASTVWLSEPERSSWKDGTDKSLPTGLVYEGMTPDGKNVFFVSDSPLLDADVAPGPDLYRYTDSPDPTSDQNLTLITDNGGAQSDPESSGGALVGMSDDAKVVYVQHGGAFITVWNDGATGTVDPSVWHGNIQTGLSLMATQPGHGRVSPDGNWLAYIEPNDQRLYVYDRAEETLACASCPGEAYLRPQLTLGSFYDNITFRPRFLSNDGRVFFTSTAALVPQDTNGVADVYSYDGPTGKLSLLSSGIGSQPAEFADASASGDDVFFATRAQLALSDHDEYADLYDARVGGGFDEAQAPTSPCLGEACQGAGAGAPNGSAISSTAATRGNLKTHRIPRCRKGTRPVKRHGKTRCVKTKQQGKHKRHAHGNRGASK